MLPASKPVVGTAALMYNAGSFDKAIIEQNAHIDPIIAARGERKQMSEARSKSGCLVCGAEIVYLQDKAELECAFCHQTKRADAHCTNGHFVCDFCHTEDPCTWIEQQCLTSDSREPIRLAIELIRHPQVAMHGPEHHFLVPAVLLAAHYNLLSDLPEDHPAIQFAVEANPDFTK